MFIILLLVQFISCKAVISSAYQLNRPFGFETRDGYLAFLQKSFKLSPEQVYYVDSSSMNAFFGKVSGEKLVEYYGAFLDDSTEIKKSGYLSENISCIGRVLHEISSNVQIADSNLVHSDFKKYLLQNVLTDTPLRFSSNNRIKIVLLYSVASGTYFNDFYRQVSGMANAEPGKVELFVISLDPVQYLKTNSETK